MVNPWPVKQKKIIYTRDKWTWCLPLYLDRDINNSKIEEGWNILLIKGHLQLNIFCNFERWFLPISGGREGRGTCELESITYKFL